jgi:hypothetical protein
VKHKHCSAARLDQIKHSQVYLAHQSKSWSRAKQAVQVGKLIPTWWKLPELRVNAPATNVSAFYLLLDTVPHLLVVGRSHYIRLFSITTTTISPHCTSLRQQQGSSCCFCQVRQRQIVSLQVGACLPSLDSRVVASPLLQDTYFCSPTLRRRWRQSPLCYPFIQADETALTD